MGIDERRVQLGVPEPLSYQRQVHPMLVKVHSPAVAEMGSSPFPPHSKALYSFVAILANFLDVWRTHMGNLVGFETDLGGIVFIEAFEVNATANKQGPFYEASHKQGIKITEEKLDTFLKGIQPVIVGVQHSMDGLDVKPSEVEATMSLKLTTDLNIVLAGTSGEAFLQLRLLWKDSKEE
jgi:hypothetical protein